MVDDEDADETLGALAGAAMTAFGGAVGLPGVAKMSSPSDTSWVMHAADGIATPLASTNETAFGAKGFGADGLAAL